MKPLRRRNGLGLRLWPTPCCQRFRWLRARVGSALVDALLDAQR